ncbi:MAG: hypothetical protein NT023_10365 [Armatimonadetes bacterium]|nr:hypothetical protein [Armatimonadota bacterium]
MKLCLSCYRLWGSQTQFCGHCGRSFGGRLCRARHLSPPASQFCVQCGNTELSEPTRCLSLNGLVLVVTGLFLCGLFRVALWFAPALGAFLRPALGNVLARMMEPLLLILLVLFLLPGQFGRDARRRAGRFVERLPGQVWRFARSLWRGARRH